MHEEFDWLETERPPYFHWWQSVGDTGHVSQTSAATQARLPSFEEAFGDGSTVPIPIGVKNPTSGQLDSDLSPALLACIVDTPPQDAVFTVVIDEAIALGHPRFRYADGKSRIYAAWQQGASFDATQVAFLPYGQELYQKNINDLLEKHSPQGDLTRSLDETAFNREARLSEPLKEYDTRSIIRRAGHGTAVLDLAAGANAAKIEDEALKRRPILAVNLPRRATIGMAGTFLEFYTIAALRRAVATIDAIWDHHYSDRPEGGFPIVVNISYGQQSGPKDGMSPYEKVVEQLQAARPKKAPLEVVMPAGNDNMMRCNARRPMSAGKKDPFQQDWRIMPEDHSSNFVEVWTSNVQSDSDKHPLKISLTAPGGTATSQWRGTHGTYIDVEKGARIYCQKLARPAPAGAAKTKAGQANWYRFRYVLCVPPTADPDPTRARPTAPAGIWKIKLTDPSVDGNVYMNVQVDQSAEPGGQRSKRSYFVQDGYTPHDDSGRPMDSYAYPYEDAASSDLEPWAPDNHIQRKGTVNSIAMNPGITVVGSHRRSDGRPNDFSATAFLPGNALSSGEQINVSAASDVGAAHLGILAAGTQAGAMVALRGTSFSAPRITRWMVDHLLANGGGTDVKAALKTAAEASETPASSWGTAAAPAKIGAGRMTALTPKGDRVERV